MDLIVKPDLSININDIESLTIEILSNKKRNTLINVLYRPPHGQIEPFEKFLSNILSKIKNPSRLFHIAGNFNLNLLDHDANRKVQRFLNIVYRNGMIPTINKPTRVTRKTATATDYILTNSFTNTVFKTVVFKSDITDHFPVCFIIPSSMKLTNNTTNTVIFKRVLDTEPIELFKQKLYETNWDDIEVSQNHDEAYKSFLNKFSDLYDTYSPKKQIKLKSKDLQSPWITNGIKKSSKRKQRLYEKFLKNQNEKNEPEYKTYKKLFESIRKRSNKLNFSNLILKCKHNIKKIWEVIKHSIGKGKFNHQSFPKKIKLDGKNITDEDLIAKQFNTYFTKIGPKLAKTIQESSLNFASFIEKCNSTQAESTLTVNKLKEAFFRLK